MQDTENKPKRPPLHQEFTQKVVDALRENNAPWQKPLTGQEQTPFNPATGTVYKGANLLNLTLSGEADPRWMTLLQVNQQDMRIAKGSRAVPIAYYQWTKDEKKLDGYGKPMLGEDGKAVTQRVTLDNPVFRVAYVFNAAQVEGMPPLEQTPRTLSENAPENIVERVDALLVASGASVVHDQQLGRAHYDHFQDVIHMPSKESFNQPERYAAEAVHQLTQWTRHESRLDRQSGPNGSAARCREELRCAVAGWMIGRELGLTGMVGQGHAPHTPGIINLLEKDQHELMRVCRDAEDIKGFVLGFERNLTQDKAQEKELTKDRESELERGAQTVAAAMPAREMEGMQAMTPDQEFAAALEKAGLDLQGRPVVWDGVTQVVGNGSYSCTKDVVPEGVIRNHDTGVKIDWTATGHVLSSEALQTQRDAAKTIQAERKVERQRTRAPKAPEKEREKADKVIALPPSRPQGQSRGLSL